MSEIRKIPYIENVLGSLSESSLKTLKAVIDGEQSSVEASLSNLPNDTIKPVLFNFEDGSKKNAIWIKLTNKAILICYHRFEDLNLYEINLQNHVIARVNVYLTIDELRRVLDDQFTSGGRDLTPEALVGVLEGSDTVVVDINEEGDKVQVRLDQDVQTKLDRALVTPLASPTSETLVGVGTGREQIQVYIGDHLSLEGDTSPYVLNAEVVDPDEVREVVIEYLEEHPVSVDGETIVINSDNELSTSGKVFKAYQITNQAITLGEMKTINDGINTRGEHVFYDVASLGANMYVCTFFTDGNTYEIMDLVSQRVIRGAYDSTKLLTICLAGADYVATQKQIDSLQEQIDELGGKKVLKNWEALAELIQSGESQNVISAGDTIYVNWIKTVIGSTISGLTVTCSDMNKFITKLGKAEENTYFFVYNGSTWTYNDEAITLSEWGLTVSGSIPTGEVMTINTTVDKVSYTFTGYDDVTAKEAGANHNWLLEQTYAPTTKAYDTYESLFNLKANSSLSAGKYKATLHSYHGEADITFYVNIPSAVNAGDKVVQFGSTGYKQVDLSGNKYVPEGVIPYVIDTTTGLQAEITCEYSVADPENYIDLSTLSQIELPLCLDHSFFGSNVWPESNIRTWLNNTGEGYTALYKFDRPSSYNMGKGFLWGIDPRVLKVMLTAKVKWTAGLGSDYTQNQTYESEDKVFLLSMKEMSFNLNTAEGNVSDLYDEYVIAEKGESMLTNDPVADRAKYNQAGGSKNSYRWSRSADTSYAYGSRRVSSTGAGGGNYAGDSYCFAPAFIVGKAS